MPATSGWATRSSASAPEPAAHEGAQALVVAAAARQHEVERHAQLAGPREERRGREGRAARSAPGAGSRPAAGAGARGARRTPCGSGRRCARAGPRRRAGGTARAPTASRRGTSRGPPRRGSRPSRSVAMVPPSRSRASSSVSSSAIARSRASSTARCAAASPVMPPPTTSQSHEAFTPREPRSARPHAARRRTRSASIAMNSGWSFTAGARCSVDARARRRSRAPRRRGRTAPRRGRRRSRSGTTTTWRAPSAASARITSLTSGSSHGSRGLPLRLW